MMNDHPVADADVPIVSEKETTLERIPGRDGYRCVVCKSYVGQRHFECPLGRRSVDKIPERVLLEELLSVVYDVDEPIGDDHTGAVNWLLEFAERVRVVIAASPPSA